MRKLFILTLFLSIQSIWAEDDVTDQLDAAWGKLKTTVSKGDFVETRKMVLLKQNTPFHNIKPHTRGVFCLWDDDVDLLKIYIFTHKI